MIGQVLSSYALAAAARSLVDRINRKVAVVILGSLLFTLGYVLLWIVILGYKRLFESFFLSFFVLPLLLFLQLASAILLLVLLGDWYVARPLRLVSFGYVAFSASAAFAALFARYLGLTGETLSMVSGIPLVVPLYVVGLGLSLMKPDPHLVRAYRLQSL